MGKSVKLMVTQATFGPDGAVEHEVGELFDPGDAPEDVVTAEVIHDDDPPAPAFTTMEPSVSEHAQAVAAAAPAPKEKAKATAKAAAEEAPAEHKSAGGKAGGRA